MSLLITELSKPAYADMTDVQAVESVRALPGESTPVDVFGSFRTLAALPTGDAILRRDVFARLRLRRPPGVIPITVWIYLASIIIQLLWEWWQHRQSQAVEHDIEDALYDMHEEAKGNQWAA